MTPNLGSASASTLNGASLADTGSEDAEADSDSIVAAKLFLSGGSKTTIIQDGDNDGSNDDDGDDINIDTTIDTVKDGYTSSRSKSPATIGIGNNKKCQQIYNDNGNNKKILLSMVISIGSFGDLTKEPYKSAQNRKSFIPSADTLKEEIRRRAALINPDKLLYLYMHCSSFDIFYLFCLVEYSYLYGFFDLLTCTVAHLLIFYLLCLVEFCKELILRRFFFI